MTLRIPLSPDQTLQTEFHEIERRLRKLERTLGTSANSLTLVLGSGGGGKAGGSPGVDLTSIYNRLDALELVVSELETAAPQVFRPVGSTATSGVVPSPGVPLPPTGVAEHVLKEDATWGFPLRGLVQVTTAGDGTDNEGDDRLSVLGSLAVNGDLAAYDLDCKSVATVDGVTLEGDQYLLWSDQRGLVLLATEWEQVDIPYDVVDVNGSLHVAGDLSAGDIACCNLYVSGDLILDGAGPL